MKNKRLSTWLLMSIFVGIIWGIWQGGFLQGFIYGSMVFIFMLAYEWYRSTRKQ